MLCKPLPPSNKPNKDFWFHQGHPDLARILIAKGQREYSEEQKKRRCQTLTKSQGQAEKREIDPFG